MMRFTQRAVMVTGVALAGLAPAATQAMAVTPSVSAGAGAAHPGNHCLRVTATIPVSQVAFGVAVNPKTDTAYVSGGDTVSVIAPCRK